MERVWETALTIMNDRYLPEQVSEIRKNYEEFQAKFREVWDRNEIIQYVLNPENDTLYDL